MKKVLSILLAMVMVLSMTTAAFAAATPTKPSVTESADVTVTKLQSTTSKVDAYKYLTATLNNDGTVKYELEAWAKTALVGSAAGQYADEAAAMAALGVVQPANNGQVSTPSTNKNETNAALAILATYASKPSVTQSVAKANGTASTGTTTGEWDAKFTALPAGSYLVLATDTDCVYNPMQVSVGWPADNNGNLQDAVGRGSTAKWSDVPFDKYITSTEGGEATADGNGKYRGGDMGVGDVVDFEIKTTVPNFDEQTYTAFEFIVTDTLDKGLTPEGAITISIANLPSGVTAPTANWTLDNQTEKSSFTADFSSIAARIKNCEITITYKAKLNENAVTGFDPNKNTAKLEYSNDPNDQSSKKPITKITYDYSFAIDGSVLGNAVKKSWEYKKTGVGEWSSTIGDPDVIISENKALADAQFTIYRAKGTNETKDKTLNYGNGTVDVVALKAAGTTGQELKGANPYTTTGDGRITFEGLDANVEYYLTETKAPQGYSINTTVTKFKFVPTYAADGSGKMVSYKVFIDDVEKFKYQYDEANDQVAVLSPAWQGTQDLGTTVNYDGTTEIKNTQLANLPSTGGMGTTLFTVAGCLIMIAAAGMFFVSRRREER